MADPAPPPGMPPPSGAGGPSGAGAAPPPPKKSGGLFAPKPKPGVDLAKSVSDLAGELNNISRRLMVLEERYSSIRKKTQVTDQNMLNNNKKFMTEIETAHSDLDEFKKRLDDMVDKLKIMVRELKECAKKEEVDVLNKYINLWEPVNFVTRASVDKMVKDQVESQFKDLNIRLQQEDYIKEQIRLALKEFRHQ